jgi:N-acetylmuramic acid 6-phosphate etherase
LDFVSYNLEQEGFKLQTASNGREALELAKKFRPDVVVRLDVGPELIAGSTRLKAGTVTKMVCNILSSVAMIRLGRVYDNLMVHVVPSNEKLKARAIRLVRMLTKVGVEEAERALFDAGGKVVEAVKKLKSGKGKRS